MLACRSLQAIWSCLSTMMSTSRAAQYGRWSMHIGKRVQCWCARGLSCILRTISFNVMARHFTLLGCLHLGMRTVQLKCTPLNVFSSEGSLGPVYLLNE